MHVHNPAMRVGDRENATRPGPGRGVSLSPPGRTVLPVADDRIWTAAELERMTPDERHRIVTEGFVTDLSTLPPEFVARIREKGRRLLEERGVISRTADGD